MKPTPKIPTISRSAKTVFADLLHTVWENEAVFGFVLVTGLCAVVGIANLLLNAFEVGMK